MRHSLSRRRFVAHAGAAIAAAAAAAPRARSAETGLDVVVVGAGLSGMNAALLLAELGARVVVLESEARAGGRCLTMDDWYLAPDLGGAQIGRDYARVLDTARKLGVKLGPGAHINAPYSFVVDGTLVAAKDWSRSAATTSRAARRSARSTAGCSRTRRPTTSRWPSGWIGRALRPRRKTSSAARRAGRWNSSRCCA